MKKLLIIALAMLLLLNISIETKALSARAAVVINGDTGEILFSSNCNDKLPMASTTKIMTALLLCENTDLDKTIVTTKKMVTVEGSSMGLLAGDTVSYRDLLYGMMLASGNDAANTTAIAVSGSVKKFVSLMNKKAKAIGLKNTHFVTPSGLDGEGHYTTAYELALLARYALNNKDFAAAVSSKSATLCYGNPPYKRTLTNHNRLLKSYDDVIGVKTGFTKKAGRCLVTAAKRDGKYVITVTLNDPDDWADHRALLDLGLSAVESIEVTPDEKKIKIPIENGEKSSIEINLSGRTITAGSTEDIRVEVSLPEFLYAPLKKDEVIGSVRYYSGEKIIFSHNITSHCSVAQKKESRVTKVLALYKYMFKEI